VDEGGERGGNIWPQPARDIGSRSRKVRTVDRVGHGRVQIESGHQQYVHGSDIQNSDNQRKPLRTRSSWPLVQNVRRIAGNLLMPCGDHLLAVKLLKLRCPRDGHDALLEEQGRQLHAQLLDGCLAEALLT